MTIIQRNGHDTCLQLCLGGTGWYLRLQQGQNLPCLAIETFYIIHFEI